MYEVAQPNEYLMITGLGIDTIKICKKSIIWPGQTAGRFSMMPQTYSLTFEAMSLEKMEFQLPVVFTIGPKDDLPSLQIYAKLFQDQANLRTMVTGVLEGSMRSISASMTLEEIFRKRKFFKQRIQEGINSELTQFGMTIYNANVKELKDAPGSEYFKFGRKKAMEGAVNQAKVDVANVRMMGSVGEKKKEGETRMMVSKIESETNQVEQQNQIEISRTLAELDTIQAQYNTTVNVATIEGHNRSKLRNEELQYTIAMELAKVEKERVRAEQYSKATVEAQVIQSVADANFYKSNAEADGKLYMETKLAEADKVMYDAQSCGITLLHKAFKEDNMATLQYIMIEQGLHKELAGLNKIATDDLCPVYKLFNVSTSNPETPLQ